MSATKISAGQALLGVCRRCGTVTWLCTKCKKPHHVASKEVKDGQLWLYDGKGSSCSIPLTEIKGKLKRLLR